MLSAFRGAHPLRAMKIQAANHDELVQMSAADGMVDIEAAGAAALSGLPEVRTAPRDWEAAAAGRWLWVVGGSDFTSADEFGPWGASRTSGCVKHSNLTGGAPAHSGGEIWRIKDKGLLLNAASGRYGAEGEAELNGVVDVLRSLGFAVGSMGFDIDNSAVANRVVVSDVAWLPAL